MKLLCISCLLTVGIFFMNGCVPPAPSAADSAQRSGTTVMHKLQHGGLTRTFALYLPVRYNPSVSHPLVIALHGGGGDAKKWPTYTNNGFERLADRDQFLLIYPEGIEGQWNDKRGVKDFAAQRDNVDDVGFIGALIDYLVSNYPVDRDRIYVAGASNGGMMANYVGAQFSDKVAAIATVIASIPDNLLPLMHPKQPLSVLMINGSEDPLVRWKGGVVKFGKKETGSVIPVEKTLQFWVNHNKLNSQPKVIDLPDKNPEDGTRITRSVYQGGGASAEVVLYTVKGGGHTWPAFEDKRGPLMKLMVDKLVGKKSRNLDACQTIWEFFKSHPKIRTQ
ncbi:MAG: PHB depolymerase family esterase [Desulfobulbaceae bacterium]|nr:PHB depolymerase family esterase [Desulfobulbaceae bacterium]